jgi:AmmeMemoRadiSam system protein B
VGEAQASEVGEVLEKVWGGPETLVVISADLSHYNEYADAQKMDAAFCRAIEALDPQGFSHENSCGYHPVRGLLYVARKKKLTVETIDMRNSGDTVGPRRGPVVGYGAWGFYETM